MSAPDTPEPLSLREILARLAGASRGFWLVNWVNFGDGIAYFGVLSLLTLFFQHDVGMRAGQATVATSTFTGLVTLFMVLGAGALSDRLGARRALGLGMVLVLVGRVILTLAPSLGAGGLGAFAAAWAAVLFMGFAEGAMQPALYAGVKQYTDEKTAAMGYAFLYAVMNLGIVLGELASPFVRRAFAEHVEGVSVDEVPTAGITGAFWFFTAITGLVTLVHLVAFTARVEARDRVDAPEADAPPASRSLRARLASLPILDARFLFFIFALLPVRTLFAHQWLTLPDYVMRCFPSEVGARVEWIQGLNPIVIVVAVPLLTAFTRRLHVVDAMIIGTLVSAGSTFLLSGAPSLGALLAYVVVFTLGEALWSSRFYEHVADLAPKGQLGLAMGIAGLPWFLAKTVTGFYAGSMLEAFVPEGGGGAPGTMWTIHGAVAMSSPLLLVLGRGWMKRTAAAVGG